MIATSESEASVGVAVAATSVQNKLALRAKRPWKFRARLFFAACCRAYGESLRTLLYRQMDIRFLQTGLSLPDVATIARKCTVVRSEDDDDDDGEKRSFTAQGKKFRGPMRRAVRLIMLEIPQAASLSLSDAARSILQPFVDNKSEKSNTLKSSTLVLMDEPHSQHITLFATGTEIDPRPLSRVGLEKEAAQIHEIAKRIRGPITLRLSRIAITETGAVLALWHVCGSTNIDLLRRRLANAISNAPIGQAEIIIHSTLARLLVKRHQLSPKLRRQMCVIARRVSQQLKGLELNINALTHVVLNRTLSTHGSKRCIALDVNDSISVYDISALHWIFAIHESSPPWTIPLLALGIGIIALARVYSYRRI